jgi:hypothetical protein
VSTATTLDSAQIRSGDFIADVAQMAEQIDGRLRRTLTPVQYALVQDLVLATRITTIAQDAIEDQLEPTVAA